MTTESNGKRIQRMIRSVPVEAIGPRILEGEQEGMWLIVDDELEFVYVDGQRMVTDCEDDERTRALIERYVRSNPDRVHANFEDALSFARDQLCNNGKSDRS